MESELFGHKKGAFTGAVEDKTGIFEAANDGTLFLDEVENLPLQIQPHLLRVLQDGEFRRLGSNKELKARCRIIAASNRNLETEVREGRLREDLFFRLTPLTLNVPPLRDRKDDIPLLSRVFLEHFNQRTGKNIAGIARPVQVIFAGYDWPGNVRELENVIERTAILTGETFIKLDSLPDNMRECHINPFSPAAPAALTLDGVVKTHLEKVLRQTSGNRTTAAGNPRHKPKRPLTKNREIFHKVIVLFILSAVGQGFSPAIKTRNPKGLPYENKKQGIAIHFSMTQNFDVTPQDRTPLAKSAHHALQA